MYPVKLKPVFKDYIWGGNRLKEKYRKASKLPVIAESWELSCHDDGQSIVENGEFAGLTLSQLIERWGKECLGKNCDKFSRFPVLVKFIDSNQPLSVQVHPNDEYALEKEGEYGKTEMWYVVEADEGASIIYGFNKDVTRGELKDRLQNNTLMDVLNVVPVKKGDSFMVNSGLVHAIGKGLLIAEIQQNSNTTYRLYDYGRTDSHGNQRPLHIEDALNVASLTRAETGAAPKMWDYGGYKVFALAECKYFTVDKYEVLSNAELNADRESFNSITFIEGSGFIEHNNGRYEFNNGETFFMPAGLGKYAIHGKCAFILTRV